MGLWVCGSLPRRGEISLNRYLHGRGLGGGYPSSEFGLSYSLPGTKL